VWYFFVFLDFGTVTKVWYFFVFLDFGTVTKVWYFFVFLDFGTVTTVWYFFVFSRFWNGYGQCGISLFFLILELTAHFPGLVEALQLKSDGVKLIV
jgi:hypothetical protein